MAIKQVVRLSQKTISPIVPFVFVCRSMRHDRKYVPQVPTYYVLPTVFGFVHDDVPSHSSHFRMYSNKGSHTYSRRLRAIQCARSVALKRMANGAICIMKYVLAGQHRTHPQGLLFRKTSISMRWVCACGKNALAQNKFATADANGRSDRKFAGTRKHSQHTLT